MEQNKLLLLLLCLCFARCVSIDMQPKIKAADDLAFVPPSREFVRRDTDGLDAYFIEPKTGNSISLKSSCFDPADPSIDNLTKAAFGGMTIIKELANNRIRYSDREALNTKRLVSLDGVPVIVEMLVFKKNNCNYLVGHVGVEKFHSQTASAYQHFLNNLRTP